MPSSIAPRTRPPPGSSTRDPAGVGARARNAVERRLRRAVPRRRSSRRRDCRPQSTFHRARAAGVHRCTGRRSRDRLAALAAAMGPIDSSIAVVDAETAPTRGGQISGAGCGTGARPARRSRTPGVICFTSGSTGQPRGGWYANRQLQAIADLDTGGAWGGGGHGLSSVRWPTSAS